MRGWRQNGVVKPWTPKSWRLKAKSLPCRHTAVWQSYGNAWRIVAWLILIQWDHCWHLTNNACYTAYTVIFMHHITINILEFTSLAVTLGESDGKTQLENYIRSADQNVAHADRSQLVWHEWQHCHIFCSGRQHSLRLYHHLTHTCFLLCVLNCRVGWDWDCEIEEVSDDTDRAVLNVCKTGSFWGARLSTPEFSKSLLRGPEDTIKFTVTLCLLESVALNTAHCKHGCQRKWTAALVAVSECLTHDSRIRLEFEHPKLKMGWCLMPDGAMTATGKAFGQYDSHVKLELG